MFSLMMLSQMHNNFYWFLFKKYLPFFKVDWLNKKSKQSKYIYFKKKERQETLVGVIYTDRYLVAEKFTMIL